MLLVLGAVIELLLMCRLRPFLVLLLVHTNKQKRVAGALVPSLMPC